ncbi:MAG: hypothetical protein Q7R66_11285 [Undibacterium sp.]|uniref:hypothetical protein n=1 Tax=Undibacterium sp. TaxID=1914977 RepID=UPI00272061D5|nr:hypothetical protein [Undibacterium sp.]MDO8652763.1 hypothetical protein [Undibacterium sp.]
MTIPHASYRHWVSPVPHCLADLMGYLVDLTGAHACIEQLLEMTPAPDNLTLAEALSTAAVIRYCRCFTSGIRQKLDINILTTASPDEIAIHDRMRGVRDWHVAHPINQQEVHALHLIVNDDPNANDLVLGMSSYQATSRSLKIDEFRLALSLCFKWVTHIQGKIVEEQIRLKPYVEQLSRAQILALPIMDPDTNSNIKTRRTQGHYK